MFNKIKGLLYHNRLGELLVYSKTITPNQLRTALKTQKTSGVSLGRILLQENIISRKNLYFTLGSQLSLRVLTAFVSLFLTFSSFGPKTVRAESIREVPQQFELASAANKAFTPLAYTPALFGTKERSSRNLEAFTKWTGMFQRFEASLRDTENYGTIREWQRDIADLRDLPLEEMAGKINSLMNQRPYIIDSKNWGKSDYWATPIEFMRYGGDCEDFAIAKYAALRALGVPEERLRIAIVHDNYRNMPHAVLVVYNGADSLILDNQSEMVRASDSYDRYRPIFSINRNAWWLHSKPRETVLASAE